MAKYPNTEKRINAFNSATTVLNSTCQLFLVTNRDKNPHGCSVLLTYNSKYYCLSNSHVLDNTKFPQVYFLDNLGEHILLEGNLIFSEPNLESKNTIDTFDIAIMELIPKVRDRLISSNYIFLEFGNIETSVNLSEKNLTMIAAYPANKTKFNIKTKTIKSNPLIIRTIADIKDWSILGFKKEIHHIVEYPKKSFRETSTKERMIAPLPHGMSGSGLWVLLGESELNYNPYLIGILSEYDENRSLIFSTKIDIYLSIIKQTFDNTIPYSGMTVSLTVV